MLVHIPTNPDDKVSLAVYHFRKPRQPNPWRVKEFQEGKGLKFANLFGGLGLAQHQSTYTESSIQAQMQASQQAQFGSPFLGCLGRSF